MPTRLPGPGLLAQVGMFRALLNEPHRALLDLYDRYGPIGQLGFGRFKYVWMFGAAAVHD